MYCVVMVTASSIDEAKKISSKLVEEKLIACANIVDNVNSVFSWKGTISDDKEVLMVMKTKKDLFGEVVEAVKANHSYDVPEVIALPILDGSEDYLKWIDESVK